VKITRAKFDSLQQHHLSKCEPIVEKCLNDAKLKKEEIDNIVLIGGSTRIPVIQNILKNMFPGKELDHRINPDEAVAKGAAILATQI